MARFAPLAAILAALILAPAASAQVVKRGPISDPRHTVGRSTSTNWSGYDVTGTGATHVIGTWTQPSATCTSGENSWSSPWVGIDGDTSNTVEQIGTDSDCSGGNPTYYAWYEMYPKSLVKIAGIPVVAGHSYTGEVTAGASGSYTLKLTDNSTGAKFQTVQTSRKSRNASIEWIMEGPSSGLLTDFGSVSFSGASGTIGGTSAAVGSFPSADPITMVTNQNVVRAQPFGLSDGSFGVSWQHS